MPGHPSGGKISPLSSMALFAASRDVLVSTFRLVPETPYFQRLITLFDAMSQKTPEIDQLPWLVTGFSGPEAESFAPVITAWQLLRYAAKLFDDAEDEPGHSTGSINWGTGFLFAAQQIFHQWESTPLASPLAAEIHRRYNLAALQACSGQHTDLSIQTQATWIDPETWHSIALAKSGTLFAWATWAGASWAGFPPETTAQYQQFGYHLGGLIQVADDFREIWGSDSIDPPISARSNLPCIYAHFVANLGKRSLLEEMVQKVIAGETGARKILADFLVELGAQKYLLAVGWLEKQQALETLTRLEGQPDISRNLHRLVDWVFPVLPQSEEDAKFAP